MVRVWFGCGSGVGTDSTPMWIGLGRASGGDIRGLESARRTRLWSLQSGIYDTNFGGRPSHRRLARGSPRGEAHDRTLGVHRLDSEHTGAYLAPRHARGQCASADGQGRGDAWTLQHFETEGGARGGKGAIADSFRNGED